MDRQDHLKTSFLSKKGLVLSYPLVLGIWTIIFLLLAWILSIRFESNDDVVMLMISSGAYSGTPDFHLVFINVIYGFLVKSLYAVLPGLEWYTILFCLLQIISFATIFWIYSKRITTTFGQLLLILLLLVLQSRFIVGIQFTTTAAIIVCAGLSLYFKRGKSAKTIGLILFLIGSLIRFEAAMLCLGIYAPLMIFPLSGRIRSKRQFLQTGIILSFIIILPVVAKIIDRQVYKQDPKWEYYMKYNQTRGSLNDNPNFEEFLYTKPTLSTVDIKDLENLANFISDPAILDLQTMTVIKNTLKVKPIVDKLENIEIWIRFYADTIVCLLALVLILTVERKATYRWSLLLSGLLFLILLSWTSLNATVKERVFLSAVMPLMLVLVLIIVNYQKKRWKTITTSAIYLLTLGTIVWQTVDLRDIKKEQIQAADEQLNLIRNFVNHDFAPLGNSFALEGLEPFNITSNFKSLDIKMIGSGWMTLIPLNQGRMDSHLDFAEKPILIFMTKDHGSVIRNIQHCMKKNYQIETTLEVIAENGSSEVVKLKKRPI